MTKLGDLFQRSAFRRGADRDIEILDSAQSVSGRLHAQIDSSDFLVYGVIGSFHVSSDDAVGSYQPQGSSASGALTVEGSGPGNVGNNLIAALRVGAPPSIDMLAWVSLHVSNVDGTQRLVTYAENVPLTYDRDDSPFGIRLDATQLGGVEDSEGTTLALDPSGAIYTTLGVRDVWFARASIGLPL